MLGKRERTIAIVAATAIGLLALDYYVISPVWESARDLESQGDVLRVELDGATKTIRASHDATRRWKDFRAAGLSADASAAESNLIGAMRTWSQESGLTLASVRPDRISGSQGMHELTYQATADGSMRAIAGFLYRIETAKTPVRIRELLIDSRVEGSDELSMHIRISTLWEDPRPAQSPQREKGQP